MRPEIVGGMLNTIVDSLTIQQGADMHSIMTEQLVLRPPMAGDFEIYKSFFMDAEASHFYGGPLRVDQAWRVLAAHIGHWHLRSYGIWMIEMKSTGQAIGGCGFVWPEGWPRRELTWWLLPEARGRGLAAEASRSAIRHAHEDYRWTRVETHMNDDNHAARGLVRKLNGVEIAREVFPDGLVRSVYELPCPD
ncbi:GNAT family N-acetyltransferase [Roseibium sp. HPY-6]|uniref:GNAT family N-acetyltransferase n=1 Tax=Roseibium sp. HPY-6 TaxID=3229852 RepID=UPI00338E5F09